MPFTTNPAEGVGISEDQAAAQILEKMGGGRAAESSEGSDDDEFEANEHDEQDEAGQSDEDQGEAEEGESSDEAGDGADEGDAAPIELEFGGQKHLMPKGTPPEVAAAVQTFTKSIQADYTRKTQQIAEQQRYVEADRQAVMQMKALSQQTVDAMAYLRMIDKQLEQIGKMDLLALSEQDPVTAQRHMLHSQQLQSERGQIVEALQQSVFQQNQLSQQAVKQALDRCEKELREHIPDLTPELLRQLDEYGKSYGYTVQELQGVTDARLIRILDKARRYDALQAAKPQVQKRLAAAPKTVKPGTGVSKNANERAVEVADTRLKKSGKPSDAAAAFLARMNRKGPRK